MTVGEAIKLLEQNGFSLLNQKGSHKKYGRDTKRITIVYHSKPKEIICKKTEKELNNLLKLD